MGHIQLSVGLAGITPVLLLMGVLSISLYVLKNLPLKICPSKKKICPSPHPFSRLQIALTLGVTD